jgi:anti-sigma regulatory factor (Ser/Thr protein kinase)
MRFIHSQAIGDQAQVGAARRAIHRFAGRLGLDEDSLAELDIVVEEIGTNAVRYAKGDGWLHWTSTVATRETLREDDDAIGVELFYWDKGPGISDFERAVRDGVSSGRGLGTGLGAVRRLTDEFDGYSKTQGLTRRLPGSLRTTHGTAILGRKWANCRRASNFQTSELIRRIGIWSRPRAGEDINGDAYFIGQNDGKTLLSVVDGLGHGSGANEAAMATLGTLETWTGEPLDEVLLTIHDKLRTTRGAVMSAVVVDRDRGEFHYAGVGNVEVRILGGTESVRPIPMNGTLGARLSQLRVWPHRWEEGMAIVMASDGVSASWDIESYPGLLSRSPQLLAGVLVRDYGRDHDDATVLVMR